MSTTNIPTGSSSAPNAAQIDSRPHRQVGWGFWLSWMLVTAAGWAIGIIVYSIFQLAIATILATILPGLLVLSLGTVVGVLFGGIIATAFGFSEGLILKQYGYSIRQFTKASLVGGIIGGAVSAVMMCILVLVFASTLSGPLIAVLIMSIAGGVTGTAVGYKQKSILDKQGSDIDNWILINAIGYTIGSTASEIVGRRLYESTIAIWPFGILLDSFSPAIVPAVLCGLIGGAITGLPLVRMLRQLPTSNR